MKQLLVDCGCSELRRALMKAMFMSVSFTRENQLLLMRAPSDADLSSAHVNSISYL